MWLRPLDPLGGLLGTERFEINSAGYKELLAWLETFGDVIKIEIEGTGSYGFPLPRWHHCLLIHAPTHFL